MNRAQWHYFTFNCPREAHMFTCDVAMLRRVGRPGSRDFDVIGAEKMIETAQRFGVPVFLKQLGSRPRLIDTGDPHGWPTTAGPVNWETGRIKLKASKGNDMSEWPQHLRVREMARVSA